MQKRRVLTVLAIASIVSLICIPLLGGDWPTFGHDPQRSGWAAEETALTPENVGGLKLLWKVKLHNEPKSLTALTAPLVADDVMTAAGLRTVVYVAGSSDVVYALEEKTGGILWTRKFTAHVLPKDPGMWLCPNNLNDTPTIDKSRQEIYTIAADGTLYGLDLGTGGVKFGPAPFVPAYSKNWSLNLRDGVIYTSISQGCGGARSGIYSLDARRPLRPVVRDLFVANSWGGGIWGRAGVAIAADGRIFASTGDGAFNPAEGEYGSSVIAASPGALEVKDYFSPLNFEKLTRYDLDISAASVIWLPYRNFSLVAGGGKEGILYLLDADSLGTRDHQTPLDALKLANDELAFEEEGIWGELSSWRDGDGTTWVYVPIWGPVSKQAPAFPLANGPNPHGCIMAFHVALDPATHQPVLKPAWISGDFDVPEPVAIANGVVFALATGENTQQTVGAKVIYSGQKGLTDQQRGENTHNAVLRALDARTGKELYQSGDAMTSWVHFSGLAVADGRVYAVDHDSNIYCFGLAPKP
ncbi:MAG TPA: PQQ-binding-like beta-propeller repeat protein [Terriglobia bacterium]|nr:PQQ-binding-like beta-propeller repeat protein [Terriglobia bacterium]